MTLFFVNNNPYRIPYEVNDAITLLLQENERMRTELKNTASILNKLRANIEGTLYPNSGFASVSGGVV